MLVGGVGWHWRARRGGCRRRRRTSHTSVSRSHRPVTSRGRGPRAGAQEASAQQPHHQSLAAVRGGAGCGAAVQCCLAVQARRPGRGHQGCGHHRTPAERGVLPVARHQSRSRGRSQPVEAIVLVKRRCAVSEAAPPTSRAPTASRAMALRATLDLRASATSPDSDTGRSEPALHDA